MKRKRNIIIFITLIGVIILFYYVINVFRANDKDQLDQNYESMKQEEVINNVATRDVIKDDLLIYTSGNGIIRASEEVDISSNIDGTVNMLNIHEGSYVKEGEKIIGIDDRELLISLEDAKVKVTEARVEYELLGKGFEGNPSMKKEAELISEDLKTLESNYSKGLLSEKVYNEKKDEYEMRLIFTGAKREEVIANKSGLTAAINLYKRAKLKYEHAKIIAPFSGAIGDCNLAIGQRISAGQKLCRLFNISNLFVEVGVLEKDIAKIKKGNSAIIIFTSDNNILMKGMVKYISPFIDNETKTCNVIVELFKPASVIKPGMFVNVKIEIEKLKNRILIPKEALLVRDNRELVFVVEDGLAKWRYVETGKQNENFIEIINGINEGEKVIISDHQTLTHDSKVKITD
jgi:HlyD family secretion protein